MKIKKMTATFGGLNQAVLTPGGGLTVITAPNEAGKSTWAGFLKAMLYGIDTRERDKGGFLADKTRYQPWSGSPMAGELQIEWRGQDITIRRFAAKSHPFGGFEAVYTASGDPVPGLTAANVGQALTGVGKDVFVRTALVGQNASAVTAAPELEQRISALATSGQEDVSYSATERKLKDWRNRRKLNRASGLIPELEEELARTRQALGGMALARSRQGEAAEQLARLEEEKAALTADLEIHRRLAQKDLNRRYAQAQEDLRAAQAALDRLPRPDSRFAGLTAQQAWELAQRQQEAERKAQEDFDRSAGQRPLLSARRDEWARKRRLLGGGLAAISLLLAVLGLILQRPPLWWACAAALLAAAAAVAATTGRVHELERRLHDLPPLEERPADSGMLEAAQAYQRWLSEQARLEAEARHCQARLDDLAAQGGQPMNTLEFLAPPARSAAETAARLAAVEAEALRWRSQQDQAIGALRDDPLALEAQAGQIEEQLSRRALEFDAIDMALTALGSANSTLRQRFSPALNQSAGEIFSRLTGQRYRQLSLSRDFSAQASPADESLPRSALYLSAGTMDQLYLSVRLAMCQLTLPGVPILLDDALAAFDDSRAELALDFLQKLSAERQILLFSCHSREARWAEAHGIPTAALRA